MNEITRVTLTVPEVATLLGVCEDTIYSMCRQNEIPHRRIRRRIVFRYEIIMKWLDEAETQNIGA